jgi:CRP/FNR family transcriptional regulator
METEGPRERTLNERQLVLYERLGTLYPLFSPELREELAVRGERLKFKAGDPIVRTGEALRATVLVLSGAAKVYREDDDGAEYYLYTIDPGEGCALSMLCAAQHRVSALKSVAEEDVEALAVPIAVADVLLQRHPSWMQFVLSTYRRRFEETLETIDAIAFRSLDERLAAYLVRAFDAHRSDELRLTHAEIATDLNSSREVISRLLKRMEQEGMVELGRHSIHRKNLGRAPR